MNISRLITRLPLSGIRVLFVIVAATHLPSLTMPVQAALIGYACLQLLAFTRSLRRQATGTGMFPVILDTVAACSCVLLAPTPSPLLLHCLFALGISALVDVRASQGLVRASIILVAVVMPLIAASPGMAVHAAPWILVYLTIAQVIKSRDEMLVQVSAADPLTGLSNKAALIEAIKFFSAYRNRNQNPASIMLIRLILTERFSLRTTSALSAYCQREIAGMLEQRLRSCDVTARYDHHCFVILLPDSDIPGSEVIVKDILAAFNPWRDDKSVKAQLQIGIASLPDSPLALDRIVATITQSLDFAMSQPEPLKNPVFVSLQRSTLSHT